MHQVEITLDPKEGSKSKPLQLQACFAENYNELTTKQLHKCLHLMFTIKDRWLLERMLLRELLSMKPFEFDALPDWVIYELGKNVRWLTETNTLTRQLQPAFRLPVAQAWQKLHGPGELFINITFAEFVVAEKHFMRYCKSSKTEDLHQLVATFYRPLRWFHHVRKLFGNYNGDQRAAFNEHLVADRSRKMAGVSEVILLAILTWYRGCREALERLYPHVFTSGESEGPKPLNPGWEPVLRGMSGGKFGDYDKTKHINVHIVLREMNEQLRQAEEVKRKSTKQN